MAEDCFRKLEHMAVCPKCGDSLDAKDKEIAALRAEVHGLKALAISLRQDRAYLRALEKIRKTNGLQYSDIFRICDEALAPGFQEAEVFEDPAKVIDNGIRTALSKETARLHYPENQAKKDEGRAG